MHTVMSKILDNIPTSRKVYKLRCLEGVLLLYPQLLDSVLTGNFRQNTYQCIS